jgi:hypothetical protein
MKQAVVVIHGVGEQIPMETLRNMVSSILDERKNPNYPKFHNKPDHMSSGYEQRMLRSLKEGRRPTTDFFEFYWAHHMRNSKLSQVYMWIARLAFRWPWNIPKALLPAYLLLWGGFLLISYLFITGAMGAAASESFLTGLVTQKPLYASVFVALIQALFSYILLGYVADAARYLTPSPNNIEQRNKIRHEGLELLKNLHESKKYSRIIIVGHSLGSVIGYDLIRLLWEDLRNPQGAGHDDLEELELFDARQKEILSPINDGTVGDKIDAFQKLQYDLFRAMRSPELDTPWLISDFVTLGSPLAHGMLLMAKNKVDFAARINEYEFPINPPLTNHDGLFYEKNIEVEKDGEKVVVSRKVPHHGAPFACTRWANIYFKYKLVLFGDFIGGSVRDIFGQGIKDIETKPSLCDKEEGSIKNYISYLLALTLLSHVNYWKTFPENKFTKFLNGLFFKTARKPSLRALKSEIHL